MKVSEIPYKRYTVEEAEKGFAAVNDKLDHAASVQDVLDAHAQAMDILTEYNTAAALSNCRFTLNTKDPFYQAEMDYYDENGPLFSKISIMFSFFSKSAVVPISFKALFRSISYVFLSPLSIFLAGFFEFQTADNPNGLIAFLENEFHPAFQFSWYSAYLIFLFL